MKIKSNNISGLILSGGMGKRVGNFDKGLLSYQDSTLIEKQLAWLGSQVAGVMVSANRYIESYQALGVPVIMDREPGFPGPLEGILQGLRRCETDWLFVHPVDVPALPANIVAQLIDHVPDNCDVAYLKTAVRAHYLSMLINKKLEPQLARFIGANLRKVKDFLAFVGADVIDLGLPEDCFANFNYLHDFTNSA